MIEFYRKFRRMFPHLAKKADILHLQLWDEIDEECAYSWFESLAIALNVEMETCSPVEDYVNMFEFIESEYQTGNVEVKNCIDVSFTENLFWSVDASKAKLYWAVLPDVLKQLYVNFHGFTPDV